MYSKDIMCLDFSCKVEHDNNKFIQVPTYTYNKLIHLQRGHAPTYDG